MDAKDSMKLPEGKVCSDCGYFYFCRQFIGEYIAKNTDCDWAPSRFRYEPPQRDPKGGREG